MDDGDWCLCILCSVCWSGWRWPVVFRLLSVRFSLAHSIADHVGHHQIESLPSPARLYYTYKWNQRADWLAFNGLTRFIWAFLLIIIPFLSRIICINRFWYSSFSSSSLSLFFRVFFPLSSSYLYKVADRTSSVVMAVVFPFPFSATVRPTVQMVKTKVIALSQVQYPIIFSFFFYYYYYYYYYFKSHPSLASPLFRMKYLGFSCTPTLFREKLKTLPRIESLKIEPRLIVAFLSCVDSQQFEMCRHTRKFLIT
jgi:hypothetical protein